MTRPKSIVPGKVAIAVLLCESEGQLGFNQAVLVRDPVVRVNTLHCGP